MLPLAPFFNATIDVLYGLYGVKRHSFQHSRGRISSLQPSRTGWCLQILGSADMDKVVRLQLARVRPGVEILPHVDRGVWALNSHRIHVPLTAPAGVTFDVRNLAMHANVGLCHVLCAAAANQLGIELIPCFSHFKAQYAPIMSPGLYLL